MNDIQKIKRDAFEEGYKAALERLAQLYEISGFKVIAESYRNITFTNPYDKESTKQ